MFQSPVAPSADFAVDGAEAYGFPPFKGGKITALLQNSVEKYLDRRRRERSEPGATSPRRMVMRHGGGRGAEAMFRGAEPLCGCAAQGRKRAGRGYMLPLARVEHGLTLWQRMLPLKPEQGRTPRTTPSTRFYNRARVNLAPPPRLLRKEPLPRSTFSSTVRRRGPLQRLKQQGAKSESGQYIVSSRRPHPVRRGTELRHSRFGGSGSAGLPCRR